MFVWIRYAEVRNETCEEQLMLILFC